MVRVGKVLSYQRRGEMATGVTGYYGDGADGGGGAVVASSSWAAWTGDSREERGVRSEDGQPGVSLPPDISARAVLEAGAGLLLRLLQEC
jgi:hypothetical protein